MKIILRYLTLRSLPIQSYYQTRRDERLVIQGKIEEYVDVMGSPELSIAISDGDVSMLKELFQCEDKRPRSRISERGNYWVLYNYISAEHEDIGCHQTITLATHGELPYLNNLEQLVDRWQSPVSVSVHAPGSDLLHCAGVIARARHCLPLIRRWVSFHIIFHRDNMPKKMPNITDLSSKEYNCSAPWELINENSTYRAHHNKTVYPVNIARNVARESALTHLVLVLDIELWPSRGLPALLMDFIATEPTLLDRTGPYVFAFPEFQIRSDQNSPENKTQLLALLKRNKAFPLHWNICSPCHTIPFYRQWLKAKQTKRMQVIGSEKRMRQFAYWEPVYVGARDQLPPFDERLSVEDKRDKMGQAYLMCVLNYDFLILNNAFVVHRPGFKDPRDYRRKSVKKALSNTRWYQHKQALPRYNVLFGRREECTL